MFKLSRELRDDLVSYLQKRPYMEVYQAIAMLMSLEKIEEPRKVGKDDKG